MALLSCVKPPDPGAASSGRCERADAASPAPVEPLAQVDGIELAGSFGVAGEESDDGELVLVVVNVFGAGQY